jgi:hypothetical protein
MGSIASIGHILLWVFAGIGVLVTILGALLALGIATAGPAEDPADTCPKCGQPRQVIRHFGGGWIRLVACDAAFSDRLEHDCQWGMVETHSKGGERFVSISREAAHLLYNLPEAEAEARVARINLWGQHPPTPDRLERIIVTPSNEPDPFGGASSG